MAKMLWELTLPVEIAKAKEDLGKDNIWKYMRYFNMFMSRYKLEVKNGEIKEDISYDYFSKILFAGKVGLVNDPVYGFVVARLSDVEESPTGKIIKASVEYDNGKKRSNLKVGKDLVIAYSDMTHLPPILYVYSLASRILEKEAIINQQDNMLRKPIVVTGEGERFDNAVNNANNILSGIEWINTKSSGKGKKGGSILDTSEIQVLNLQLGNAYKGPELWDSRKKYEELLSEYLGFTTTKNEKRERMNTSEVKNDNTIGMTFRKSAEQCINNMIEEVKRVLGVELTLTKNLEEEVIENGGEENMGRTSDRDSRNIRDN